MDFPGAVFVYSQWLPEFQKCRDIPVKVVAANEIAVFDLLMQV